VQTSATGTWFQTPEAYDFFASQPELFMPFVFAIMCKPASESGLKDKETLRGVCVGYVTKEKNVLKQFFSRRAIIIGGPALADDCTDEEVEVLMNAVRKHLQSQAIYIETRNFNDYSRWKNAFEKAGFGYQPHLNFHIDCTDRETMWSSLSETRRRQIRHVNNDLKFSITDCTEQDVLEWYEILAKLYRTKVKTPLFPVSFFLAFYRQKRGVFLLQKHEGKVIGGIMCPIFENRCIYEWYICGMDAEYKESHPSVMATWAAMEYANTHGIARFDFMGAGVPDVPYGVRDFKAEFGGQLVEHGRFLHVVKPTLYALGKAAIKVIKG
jgi:hypothetical protein